MCCFEGVSKLRQGILPTRRKVWKKESMQSSTHDPRKALLADRESVYSIYCASKKMPTRHIKSRVLHPEKMPVKDINKVEVDRPPSVKEPPRPPDPMSWTYSRPQKQVVTTVPSDHVPNPIELRNCRKQHRRNESHTLKQHAHKCM